MAFDLKTAKPAPQGFDLATAKLMSAAEPDAEPTMMDRARSVVTGINRGAGTRLLGLPVDTIVNVADLVKAGVGSAYMASTGKVAPDFLASTDRANVVGTGDWIERKVRENGAGAAIDPTGPQDGTARVLHGLGMGAGGAIAGGRLSGMPMTNGAITRAAVGGGASGTAGAVATEMGASPDVAILASMGPQLAARGLTAGTKAAVRGGEQGRRAMEQRIQDLKDAGIDSPSLGLASANNFLMGLENLMSKVPGSGGLYADHRAKMIEGMMNKAGATRDLASTQYGADTAGRVIQSDLLSRLKPRIESGYDRANDQMVSQIPAGQRFPITNSLNALADATAVNPLAPATTSGFVQPRIAALRQNMLADTQATQPNQYYPTTVNTGMPVSATRAIRTSIGKEAASRAISGTPEQAEWQRVYGGLSDDIRVAARQTDMAQGPQPNNRGPVERSFDRGNALYRAGMERIDRVQPFANKDAPEQSYNALMQSGKENVSTFRAVKKSVSEETRATVAATTIDRMGRAKPGQQNEVGDVWSQETFLTNWNQLTPAARMEMFSGFKGAAQVRSQIEAIAKGSSMIRDSSKVWANPSGTGGNMMAAGTLGGIASNALTNPLSALGTLAGLGLARTGSANLLLNPKVNAAFAKESAPRNRLADLMTLSVNAEEAKKGQRP